MWMCENLTKWLLLPIVAHHNYKSSLRNEKLHQQKKKHRCVARCSNDFHMSEICHVPCSHRMSIALANGVDTLQDWAVCKSFAKALLDNRPTHANGSIPSHSMGHTHSYRNTDRDTHTHTYKDKHQAITHFHFCRKATAGWIFQNFQIYNIGPF